MQDNPDLVGLAGLAGLTGSFTIDFAANPVLVELPVSAPGTVNIVAIEHRGNDALPNLDALYSWSAGSPTIVIDESGSLASVAGLEALTNADRLTLHGLSGVPDLQPLSQLTVVSQSLHLDDMPLVTSLLGLDALASVGELELGWWPEPPAIALSLGLTPTALDRQPYRSTRVSDSGESRHIFAARRQVAPAELVQ